MTEGPNLNDKENKMLRILLFVLTHLIAFAIGIGLAVFFLPIITAEDSPDEAVLEESAQEALFTGEFDRDLEGSDLGHWGEGTISVTPTQIVHQGRLSPGPDYKLYLVPEFVETEEEFLPIKSSAQRIGDVKSFNGLILDVPPDVDIDEFNTVLIWCEAFSQFITAAKYK